VSDGPGLQKIIVAVHGPVDDRVPETAGLRGYAVLRPSPDEPSPHPASIGAVALVWLDPEIVPEPGRWFDAPVDAYRVDEHVPLDRAGDQRGAAPAWAVVQCSFVRRLPGLTREEFAAHWRDVHAPLVPVHHPGVGRYVQNVVVEGLTPDAPAVDGIAQLYFRTADDFRARYYDSEAGRAVVGADVATFIDRPRGWRIHARETRPGGPIRP
jgi:uncharacterized protein (TIGR02118 family)